MNPIRRDAKGPITLQEARLLFRDLIGHDYTAPGMQAAWHAFRIGIRLAQDRSATPWDQRTLRKAIRSPKLSGE